MFRKLLLAAFAAEVNYLTGDVRCYLLKSTYTPDYDAHDYLDDLVLATNELATGGGYTAGGQALTSKTKTYVAANSLTV